MSRHWSPARVATGFLLASWAAMFWFLLISGRDLLYVSTRTQWVVPTGAIILTGAALGRLTSARTRTPETVGRKEAWVIGFMMIPVITVMVLPPAALGTYAVSRRSSFLKAGVVSNPADLASGELTLVDLASTPTTELGADALAQRAGDQVSFIGIVNRHGDTSADEFILTRFIVTCCIADATVAAVRVVDVTPGLFADGEWVQVDGAFYPVGSDMIVAADAIKEVPQPHNPYLTP